MNIHSFVIVFSLLLSIDRINAQKLNLVSQILKNPNVEKKICGPKIHEMFDKICYDPKIIESVLGIKNKRSVELIEQHIKEEQEIVRRFPRSLLNKLDGTQRLKRGIYVDCCQRACTLREFMNYCPSIISQQNAS